MLNTHSQERQIALTWLARLRWFAVGGQLAATIAAVIFLHLQLPIGMIAVVIGITAVSNVAIECLLRRKDEVPAGVLPLIIILDVCLLTLLLLCTGGANNPFSILYVVHVAMAVVTLGSGWAWAIIVLSGIGYVLILRINQAITPALTTQQYQFGQWMALILVTGLIAYFTGRVMRSLRRREGELAEMRERAGRSAYLASLTTLAGGAAHELGTPLGTIALVAKELELAATKQGDESIIEDTKLIRQECDRCRSILDRMRVDVLDDLQENPHPAQLQELLTNLKEELKPAEKDRLRVETLIPTDTGIPHIRVLRTAISVLIKNAFDASEPGKPVTLKIAGEENRLTFQVIDSGSGMDEETLKRAGEPFFTTKPVGKGMGMGLFLVRLVAESFGGKLRMESTPGLGTKSTIDLPKNRA